MIALVLGAASAAPPALTLGDPAHLSLKPGVLLDARATSMLTKEPSLALQVQRARPNLRGTLLGSKARYFVQAELAGGVSLLDAVIQLQPVPWFEVSAGRFLVPFTRAQLTPVPKLQFHGFSPSANADRHGRDVGLQLRALPGKGRLDARIGVFQGASDDVPRPLVISRISLDIIGRVALDETESALNRDSDLGLSLGVGAAGGADKRVSDEVVLQSRLIAADMAMHFGPARMQGEFFARSWEDGLTDLGGYVQASVSPISTLEVAGRFDVLDTDTSQWTAQGLVSWYTKGDHLRTTLEYTWQRPDNDVAANQSIAIQQQLWF